MSGPCSPMRYSSPFSLMTFFTSSGICLYTFCPNRSCAYVVGIFILSCLMPQKLRLICSILHHLAYTAGSLLYVQLQLYLFFCLRLEVCHFHRVHRRKLFQALHAEGSKKFLGGSKKDGASRCIQSSGFCNQAIFY